jgi:hypothetical protein
LPNVMVFLEARLSNDDDDCCPVVPKPTEKNLI